MASEFITYIAFLRGINVGGKHKVPMEQLRKEMESLGFSEIVTILNSGNIIFKGQETSCGEIEERISSHLEKAFGFLIPTIVINAADLKELLHRDPFAKEEITKDKRAYITFLQNKNQQDLKLPWTSEDGSFRILDIRERLICSLLDLSMAKTPDAMKMLEKFWGKQLTTRNWNTLNRIAAIIE